MEKHGLVLKRLIELTTKKEKVSRMKRAAAFFGVWFAFAILFNILTRIVLGLSFIYWLFVVVFGTLCFLLSEEFILYIIYYSVPDEANDLIEWQEALK